MSRISRKELKTNEFVEEVSKTVDYVQSHKDRMVQGAILAVVLLLAAGAGYYFYSSRTAGANEALGRAIRTYHAPVKPVSLGDSPTDDLSFTTHKARLEQSLKLFQEVAGKYQMMSAGKVARYYIGLCQLDLGNVPEAEKELTAASTSGNAYVDSLARLALAGTQARGNKLAEAEQNYRYLIEHPSPAVPKVTAQLALASFLQPTKPAEAEKIYKELEAGKPGSEVAGLVQKARNDAAKPDNNAAKPDAK